jgi:hypothetical protein
MELVVAKGRGRCQVCRKYIFPKEYKMDVAGQAICLFCLKDLLEQEAEDVRKES